MENDHYVRISEIDNSKKVWNVQGVIFEISKESCFKTSKGISKKRLSFDINDGSAEIKVVCFLPTERADIEFKKLELNKVAKVNLCLISMKDSKRSKSSNIYELIFTENSKLDVIDNTNYKDMQTQYNLTVIGDILKLPENHFVDLIGIVNEVGELKCAGNKEFCEVVLIDDSNYSIVCSLWGDLCGKLSNELKKGAILMIKAGKTSYKYHGRAIMVGNYSLVKVDPENIGEAEQLKKWFDKKNFGELKNIAYNKCLLLDGDVCGIDVVLDHVYNDSIPLIKNIKSKILSIKEGSIYCCTGSNCDNALVELQAKNRYICKKCKNHVLPKSIAKIEVQIGENDKSIRALCFGEMAESLSHEYKAGRIDFIFRIYGILKNTGVAWTPTLKILLFKSIEPKIVEEKFQKSDVQDDLVCVKNGPRKNKIINDDDDNDGKNKFVISDGQKIYDSDESVSKEASEKSESAQFDGEKNKMKRNLSDFSYNEVLNSNKK